MMNGGGDVFLWKHCCNSDLPSPTKTYTLSENDVHFFHCEYGLGDLVLLYLLLSLFYSFHFV